MDKDMDIVMGRPAAASLMARVGLTPPPGVGCSPSGGSICHLKLTGCKSLKMAESLNCLCERAERQMVAKTACGTDSHCEHCSHSAWANTHTRTHKQTHRATGSRSVSLALTDDSVAPPAEPPAPAWCVSFIGGNTSFSSASSFSSICRGVEPGGRLQKVTDISANLVCKAQKNQKILVLCWLSLLVGFYCNLSGYLAS